ncbi:hypothetical protein M2451_001831 [Dysgonomonas sp. PFB1-18]|uniref:hypothetical protein n=1 Tax=unclassified Dysgonomonas TaxID=2630389 RepID=UPI002475721C|nr:MULTISPECIES: hypothetical protein [unclassified Dysgonomonas]MDH6309260.1 hypothetical protein [Dysgonomonas sp. PF1-14]MDH6338860.1 hypothetical protein [Dysgonomonas sp. PF1-16]MDH6380509.1 hypothetical protein [Dysgonomonas sp. PFB1-18]MDH6397688.1 hypothetical protein [Dysgonomonas sp. PF1-23]
MKKVLFSLLASVLVLASCGGPSPVAFNDAITNANSVIMNVQSECQDAIAKSMENKDYSSIVAQTDSALAKIDAELAVVKALEVPKGGDAFKEAAVKTYESLRSMVETGKKFSALNSESSEDDYNKIYKEYEGKMEESSKLFDELATAQMNYAKEAGYEVR